MSAYSCIINPVRAAFLALFTLGLSYPAFADTELNIPGYRVLWHDEFQGETVDPAKWTVNEGANVAYRRQSDGRWVEPHWFGDAFEPWTTFTPINDERQYYSSNNVEVVDRALRIRADRESVVNPLGWYDPDYHRFTSGKLNTARTFQFRFGIVRIRAQLPEGQGLWPALWMLNAPDPWYWDDEIDIMEGRGSQPTITTSAHHFKVPSGGGGTQNQYNWAGLDTGINLQTSFNVYSLQWEPAFMQTWVNKLPVFYDEQAIPQGPMFLIMNAAVGGMFDGNPTAQTTFPTYFKVDWVRVWQPAQVPSDLASGGFEEFQGSHWANWNTRDDGNLTPYPDGIVAGSHAVRIGPGSPLSVTEPGPAPVVANLFTDGTAGEWAAYLNRYTDDGSLLGGDFDNLANIPATVGPDSLVLPVHQTAASARANAVAFRQIAGSALQGRSISFSGEVAIEEAFPNDATAIAFIRIFNSDFSFTDVAIDVTQGGHFNLQTTLADSGIPFVQVGLETTGTTASAGRMAASQLKLTDDLAMPPLEPIAEGVTGLSQTVLSGTGDSVRYGVVVANHAADPLGSGAEGRLSLDFLNAQGQILATQSTVIVDSQSGTQARLISLTASKDPSTAQIRLRIERVPLETGGNDSGSFLVDAAFLYDSASTALPRLISPPPASVTVNAGALVNLPIELESATPLSYAWFRNGAQVSSSARLDLQSQPDSSGTYILFAANDAGPLASASVELTVLNPDADGDGFTDYEERFITRTDPLDPASRIHISRISLQSELVTLEFQSVPDIVTYQVGASADLMNWLALGEPFSASGSTTTVTRNITALEPPRTFFRIEVVPAP